MILVRVRRWRHVATAHLWATSQAKDSDSATPKNKFQIIELIRSRPTQIHLSSVTAVVTNWADQISSSQLLVDFDVRRKCLHHWCMLLVGFTPSADQANELSSKTDTRLCSSLWSEGPSEIWHRCVKTAKIRDLNNGLAYGLTCVLFLSSCSDALSTTGARTPPFDSGKFGKEGTSMLRTGLSAVIRSYSLVWNDSAQCCAFIRTLEAHGYVFICK